MSIKLMILIAVIFNTCLTRAVTMEIQLNSNGQINFQARNVAFPSSSAPIVLLSYINKTSNLHKYIVNLFPFKILVHFFSVIFYKSKMQLKSHFFII